MTIQNKNHNQGNNFASLPDSEPNKYGDRHLYIQKEILKYLENRLDRTQREVEIYLNNKCPGYIKSEFWEVIRALQSANLIKTKASNSIRSFSIVSNSEELNTNHRLTKKYRLSVASKYKTPTPSYNEIINSLSITPRTTTELANKFKCSYKQLLKKIKFLYFNGKIRRQNMRTPWIVVGAIREPNAIVNDRKIVVSNKPSEIKIKRNKDGSMFISGLKDVNKNEVPLILITHDELDLFLDKLVN